METGLNADLQTQLLYVLMSEYLLVQSIGIVFYCFRLPKRTIYGVCACAFATCAAVDLKYLSHLHLSAAQVKTLNVAFPFVMLMWILLLIKASSTEQKHATS